MELELPVAQLELGPFGKNLVLLHAREAAGEAAPAEFEEVVVEKLIHAVTVLRRSRGLILCIRGDGRARGGGRFGALAAARAIDKDAEANHKYQRLGQQHEAEVVVGREGEIHCGAYCSQKCEEVCGYGSSVGSACE